MATTHIVQQGEFLSLIAAQYGFATHSTLWDHEKNKALKEKRKNPNVLFPGDEVFIPDKEQKQVDVAPQQLTTFSVKRDRLKLRLVLEERYGKPLADSECEVRVDGKALKKRSDDKGTIEVDLAVTALKKRSAELAVKELGGEEIVVPLEIGSLDPVTEESGQRARLNNLGYFAGEIEDDVENGQGGTLSEEEQRKKAQAKEENELLFISAVEEFQCDHHLVVDGKCGSKTQAKLKEVHGC